MVPPENIDTRHSNSQLGNRCSRRSPNLAHLGKNVITIALKSAIACSRRFVRRNNSAAAHQAIVI
jgi:hypothetical protein